MNRSPHRTVLLLVLVLVVAVPLTGSPRSARAAPDEPSASSLLASGAAAPAASQERPTPDDTVTRVQVYANGTARWTVRIRTRLDNDSREREWAAFESRFRQNRSRYLDPFRQRITGVVDSAAAATGREMSATVFTASAGVQEVPRRWGVVTFSFTWRGFAAVDGDAVVVGDAFSRGFFLGADDSLTLAAPPNYRLADAAPNPSSEGSTSVEWRGRVDFAADRPHARFVPAPSTTDADGGTTAPPPDGWDLPSSVLLAGVGLVALGTAAGYLSRSSRGPGGASEDGSDDPPDDRPADGDSPGAVGDDDATDAPDASPPILTDEDRVVALLDEHGGRVKQASLAAELDWSASKTSRVVSEMAEAGTIEKLRLGRENVIDLVDEE